MSAPNPYILASDNSPSLLPLLRSNPVIASSQDEHGYSLLHAASSYGHVDLLRTLVREFHVDINLTDEDGETCIFVAETVEVARCLIEELGIDKSLKNNDGVTAEDAVAEDGSFPLVAAYLKGATTEGNQNSSATGNAQDLPQNVNFTYNTMDEPPASESAGVASAEFKRRIDELASKENFFSEGGQEELRQVVANAVKDVGAESQQRDVRRRVD